MSRDDIIQNVKDAKFQFEFMALMLLAGRNEKVAEAYECGITKLAQIANEDVAGGVCGVTKLAQIQIVGDAQ